MKRMMRKLPFIGDWPMFRVLYSQSELERLEIELNSLQAKHDRLAEEGQEVLEETRSANPVYRANYIFLKSSDSKHSDFKTNSITKD